MTNIKLLLLPLLLVSVIHAQADIFTCRDSAGHLITSDRAISECAGKTTQVYTNSVVMKEQLAGELTPEQRHAAELSEQQKAKEALLEEQNQKEIRYLKAHYPAEQDIGIARQRKLEAINAKIAKETLTIKASTEALQKHRNLQKHLQRTQVDIIKAKAEEDGLLQSIQQSGRLVQRFSAEKADINRQFDATHKRYSELVSSNSN